jgi:protein-S-isoprenylcysteine O-methyltransferase Ste14
MKHELERIEKIIAEKPSWLRRQRINVLRLTALVFGILLLISRPILEAESGGRAAVDSLGILLIVSGILGRFWSIIYIGGRKSKIVLSEGPYSICRHPLYLFSTIATVGVGLTFGSILLAAALGLVVFFILHETARHEEIHLTSKFGVTYQDYARRVPMLIPEFGLWRNSAEIALETRALYVNFKDALVFASFIPLSRLVNWAREAFSLGIFPVL